MLRAFAAVAKDLGLVPSTTHIAVHQTSVTLILGVRTPSSVLNKYQACEWCTYIQADKTLTPKIKLIFKKINFF